jgi:rubredoxin
MDERRCPDCGMTMERTELSAGGQCGLFLETERDGGLLDSLGIDEHVPIDSVVCPECGLVRLYAGSDE